MDLYAQMFGISWEAWEKYGFPGLVTFVLFCFLLVVLRSVLKQNTELRSEFIAQLKSHSEERNQWRQADIETRRETTQAFKDVTEKHTEAMSEMTSEIRKLSEKVLVEIHGSSSRNSSSD